MEDNCSICLQDMTENDFCKTECGHMFHSSCIFKVVVRDPKCPLCRYQLITYNRESQDSSEQETINMINFENNRTVGQAIHNIMNNVTNIINNSQINNLETTENTQTNNINRVFPWETNPIIDNNNTNNEPNQQIYNENISINQLNEHDILYNNDGTIQFIFHR